MMETPLRTGDRETHARRWRLAGAALIGVMLVYFVVTNHVDLYPWNNLDAAGNQWPSTLVGLIPFSIYAVAFAVGIRWLMLVGMVHSYIWLALQIRQWWVPYLFGATPLHRDLSWYAAGGYTETLRILPLIGDRPAPDAQHLVLELISLGVVLVTTVAVCLVFPRTAVRSSGALLSAKSYIEG
jgi:hypothetical protein